MNALKLAIHVVTRLSVLLIFVMWSLLPLTIAVTAIHLGGD